MKKQRQGYVFLSLGVGILMGAITTHLIGIGFFILGLGLCELIFGDCEK